MAVAQGLVSLHFVNVLSRPVVAPWGGADGRYGTNPCCIGVLIQGREPFVLDFATSKVARSEIRKAREHGHADRGYRTVFNCNREAGQSVFHIHLHLLAGRAMTWPPG